MKAAVEAPPNGLPNSEKMIQIFSETFRLEKAEAEKVLENAVVENFPSLSRHFFPVPGAQEFIQWAKSRYSLVLATNPIWLPEIVELRLRWAGVSLKDFVTFTHARRMHSCKPRVDYYQELLSQEKLRPEQCFMIGNDRRKDLPATRLGMPVYLLNRDPGGLNSESTPLDVKEGSGSAWSGTYMGLRKLLEKVSSG
jgi:FMN phosphatase YigB (HAD superfamily)